VFALARAEQRRFEPALRSMAFPLLGAGRGGLHPATSFAWIWTSLEREVTAGDLFQIHFITLCGRTADLIAARLAETGAVPRPPDQAS